MATTTSAVQHNGRVNDSYPGTRLRAFRISDELYDAAKAEAKEVGEPLSDVVRRALEEYAGDRLSKDPDPD